MIAVKIYSIRGSSNLSVDIIYSIAALRISVLPHNRVFDKEELVNSSNLQSFFFNLRVYLLSSNMNSGECEIGSISKQIGFKQIWELCLDFCSRNDL